MINFGKTMENEVFNTHLAVTAGMEVKNQGSKPLTGLRYFGPGVHNNIPNVGDHKVL